MAPLKAIFEIILPVDLGECARDLTKCVSWVPENNFFLSILMVRSPCQRGASVEEKELLLSTVSTVYFISPGEMLVVVTLYVSKNNNNKSECQRGTVTSAFNRTKKSRIL